jgi:hypothetical protein
MKISNRVSVLGAPFQKSAFSTKLENQNVLLNDGPDDDIQKVKQIAKIHSDAELNRMIDKLSIRKEYHQALANNGMKLDTIVREIKLLCATSKDDVKLKAYTFLLKSLGLDKYEELGASGKSWEELILRISEQEKIDSPQKQNVIEGGSIVYPVKIPEIPEEVASRRKAEAEMTRSIYEPKNSRGNDGNGTTGENSGS